MAGEKRVNRDWAAIFAAGFLVKSGEFPDVLYIFDPKKQEVVFETPGFLYFSWDGEVSRGKHEPEDSKLGRWMKSAVEQCPGILDIFNAGEEAAAIAQSITRATRATRSGELRL